MKLVTSLQIVFTCALTISHKRYEDIEKGKQIILKLMNFLEVAPKPKEAIINACTSNFKDLEDAFQHYSALLISKLP